MPFGLRPFVVLWIILALVVIALIVWRKVVAWHEDDSLDLHHSGVISHQITVARKLDLIDKWGPNLTIITLALGLLIAVAYIYDGWIKANSLAM